MISEFLESELELYVQRLLIHEFYTNGNEYKMLKISPNKERLKGYDAEIVGLTSFYCQFKTSEYLIRGPLYQERQDLYATLGWPMQPFYKFRLREPNNAEDKKNSKFWQHNVLHSMWKHNPSGVAYVAPIFHTRMELDLQEPFGTWSGCLYDDRFGGIHRQHGSSAIAIQVASVNGENICRVPFFDGLISIPPHASVTHLKHNYCFTSSSDITFHSEPERVNGQTLFQALKSFVLEATANDGQKVSAKRMKVSEIKELIGIGDQDPNFLESFLNFGLSRSGVSNERFAGNVSAYFENDATWLQQRIAFSAALSAYFGISTLALLKIKEG